MQREERNLGVEGDPEGIPRVLQLIVVIRAWSVGQYALARSGREEDVLTVYLHLLLRKAVARRSSLQRIAC